MDAQKIYDKQISLCREIDAVIDLSARAQESVSNNQLFFRQVALLFHRIDAMEALKDDAMLCSLEALEKAARSIA